MFYSHEILTSRESGLATVWLVATLGSRSNLKKVNRKAILDVDVPKTCGIIIQPEAPMALRLQSNLLYGVSRVFSQQYGYVLSDAHIAQSNMRALLKAVRTSELDPNAGKARPDQLMIQDDPAFLPDLALPGLDIDLSALDISTDESSRRSSILLPHSQRSSISSHHEADESMLGLIIPTSETGGAVDIGGFQLPSDNLSSARRSARVGRFLEEGDEGFNIDPGFSIDAEGNLIEDSSPTEAAQPGILRLGSDSAASGRVRQELQEGLRAGQFELEAMNIDLDLPKFDDDDLRLPDAEAFPAQSLGREEPHRLSSEIPREHESSESAEAPMRRRRREPRELATDARQELRNADLAAWKDNYLANMSEAAQHKANHKASSVAKKNAAFWVVGSGIGGVGARLGSPTFKSPLDMFAGDAMMEALTGVPITNSSSTTRKRGREDEEDETSDNDGRRVRPRDVEDQQIGRGDAIVIPDDETMEIPGSDGIEIGRHAPPPLEDPSMPWNISVSSRAGSIARNHPLGFPSSIGGFPTSGAGPLSLPRQGSLDHRASRLTSASPLVGRGRERYSSLELPIHEDDDELLGGRHVSDEQALQSFELYGPGAGVATQTAAQSQWVRETLNQEAGNFLEFVTVQIAAIEQPEHDEEEDELAGDDLARKETVSFEELLPPGLHSKIVAAQALHHVLTLGTKSLLTIRQWEPYGQIELGLPVGV